MTLKKGLIIIVVAILAIVVGKFYWHNLRDGSTGSSSLSPSITANQILSTSFGEPISRAKERVTKKPFGIYVTPANSPVSPEKFTGYHTGVDFETFPDSPPHSSMSVGGEQDIDVPIYAICDGVLVEKISATGYGGVVVQRCDLGGQPITVIYGHLKLSSIATQAGQPLKQGELLGILGRGYSSETSGERKHLHLGIHRGTTINILGYVQKQSELSGWINFLTI